MSTWSTGVHYVYLVFERLTSYLIRKEVVQHFGVLRIKLTSKRQATFPAEVCKQLGIGDGDTLELQPLRYKKETVWVLKPIARLDRHWIGSLRKYAKKASRPWTREEHEGGTGHAWAKESGR